MVAWSLLNERVKMKTITTQITESVERIISTGGQIVVFPCGDVGIQVINIMKNVYGIEPDYLIDNHKCHYSERIHDVSFLGTINADNCFLLLASVNVDVYEELKRSAAEYFPSEKIIEFEDMRQRIVFSGKTIIGRYSCGSICCNHQWIESIGSFCSFAPGVEVVTNHEMRYITTHPMIYAGCNCEYETIPYSTLEHQKWFFPKVQPRSEMIKKQKRLRIGNDVWLGRNVIITNSANIGNGVIAAAGAVITKDIPDYAIVAGVPARIIRYRYTPAQIVELNKIAWWNWSDKEIRERYDDFYLPVEDFIEKYRS